MNEPKEVDEGSTMGEYWNDVKGQLKERSMEKREKNRKSSATILRESNIKFEEKNNGAHLVVTHKDKVVDFWPGTGLWHVRKSNVKRRGVFPMIRFLIK